MLASVESNRPQIHPRKVLSAGEFERLIHLQLETLYALAMRYTKAPDQAEDLVHDTVVRALRFRDRFEVGSNFRAWLYTILTNTFIHKYRRNKREREILEGNTREDVADYMRSEESRMSAKAPERAYLQSMLCDDVLQALASLPEDFRIVVVMCDLENLSYRKIAKILDCPIGTVMSRLFRARRMLESQLQALAIEQGIVRTA